MLLTCGLLLLTVCLQLSLIRLARFLHLGAMEPFMAGSITGWLGSETAMKRSAVRLPETACLTHRMNEME